jgi:hypothetical protein
MFRRLAAICLIAAFPICALAQAERSVKCYVVMKEGASAEGNALYLQKMVIEPEGLKSFAPVAFARTGKVFSVSVNGEFDYSAGSPVIVDRSGRVALYEVPLLLSSGDQPQAAPVAFKKVKVTVKLADLAKAQDLVQPSIRAIDLAAASAKMKSGTAWILDMKYAGKGRLEAQVGLAQ